LNVATISSAIDNSARESGFAAQHHTVEIMGLCPRCQAKQVAS
jgi:Fe2+ or Zn2+ uptake regulation protein